MKIALVIVNKTTFNASFRTVEVHNELEAETLIQKEYNSGLDKVSIVPRSLVPELIAELQKASNQRY